MAYERNYNAERLEVFDRMNTIVWMITRTLEQNRHQAEMANLDDETVGLLIGAARMLEAQATSLRLVGINPNS